MSKTASRYPNAEEGTFDWAFRAIELRALSKEDVNTLRKFLELLRGEEAREQFGEFFGDGFTSALGLAPREFSVVSFVAHASLIFPLIMPAIAFLPSFQDGSFLDPEDVRKAFGRLFDPFAPWFAGANYSECEFCGLRGASWHETAFHYVVRSLQIAKETAGQVREQFAERAEDQSFQEAFEELVDALRRSPSGKTRELVRGTELKGLAEKVVRGIGVVLCTSEALGGQCEGEPRNAVRGLAMRMQQELPRAWCLKYGSGNTTFAKLEESVIAVIEQHVGKGRPCASRNALFLKWKNEEALGDAAIRQRWNGMPIARRKGIAPACSGNVTRDVVKTATRRERERQSAKRLRKKT